MVPFRHTILHHLHDLYTQFCSDRHLQGQGGMEGGTEGGMALALPSALPSTGNSAPSLPMGWPPAVQDLNALVQLQHEQRELLSIQPP